MNIKTILGWSPSAAIGLIVAAVYASWTVAFVQLGRRPVPMFDDPKYIGGFSTDFSYGCSLAIVSLMAVWVLGSVALLVVSALPQTKDRRRWFVRSASAFGSILVLLLMVRIAPGDAFIWFID